MSRFVASPDELTCVSRDEDSDGRHNLSEQLRETYGEEVKSGLIASLSLPLPEAYATTVRFRMQYRRRLCVPNLDVHRLGLAERRQRPFATANSSGKGLLLSC